MSAAAPVPAPMLSGELAPALLRATSAVVVFEVGEARVAETAPDGIDTGMLRGRAVAVLRAGRPEVAAGAALLVPFSRAHEPMARIRQGFNRWNTLDLAPGTKLALIGQAAPGEPATLMAVAGGALGPATEGQLREALRQAGDPPHTARGLRVALAAALQRDDTITRDVLLLLASEGTAIGRLPAIEALAAVLRELPSGTDARLLIGALGSTPLYDPGLGADVGNALVLGGLAARLHGADADLAILTMAGCLLGHLGPDPAEDAATRHKLAAEAFGDVPGLIDTVRKVATTLSPPVRERAAELAAALAH